MVAPSSGYKIGDSRHPAIHQDNITPGSPLRSGLAFW